MDKKETQSFMPEAFLKQYDQLLDLVFGPGRGFGSPGNMSEAGKGKGDALGNNYVTSDGGLKSEKALHYRRCVDRRLRYIGRDIKAWLEEGETGRKAAKKCYVCGKFVEIRWEFCAWCGYDLDMPRPNP